MLSIVPGHLGPKIPKLFQSIIKKQRQKGNDIIIDLHVGDQCFTGEHEVINGVQKHFQYLAKWNPGRFGHGSFRPGSFRPGSFRPNFGVGRF